MPGPSPDDRAVSPGRRPAWIAAIVAAVVLPIAAVGLYIAIGNPRAVDEARAFGDLSGPLTAEKAPAFRDQLAKHLAGNPRDGRAWALLGRIELSLDRFAEAEAAFARAVADAKVALDPGVWCDYADAAGLAQGGTLKGKPLELVAKALALQPANPRALELAGSGAYEQADYAGASRYWRELLAQLPAGSSQHQELAAAIARAERFLIGPAGTPR